MLLPTQHNHNTLHLRHWQVFLICMFTGAACFFSPLSWSLDSDSQQPLEASADSAELNEGEGFAIYSGNVIVTRGTMKIKASTIKVTFNDDGVQSMLAKGGHNEDLVHMFQQLEPDANGQSGTMEAWGNNINYQVNEEYLTLLGNAKLVQRGNEFNGPEIFFDIPKDYVKAGGTDGKRVKMIFLPKSN